jgi:hypothetical protein
MAGWVWGFIKSLLMEMKESLLMLGVGETVPGVKVHPLLLEAMSYDNAIVSFFILIAVMLLGRFKHLRGAFVSSYFDDERT